MPLLQRRRDWAVLLVFIACVLSGGARAGEPAQTDAAAFPSRPVRVLVGFTPGGGPDITARYIAQKLSERWKQQVVVDNRPGAGGTIAAQTAATANPDGYTLLSVSSAHAVAPAIYAKLPYSMRDLSGITQSAVSKYLLVVAPSSSVKSVKDLLGLAKAKPGQLNFSSAGTGSGTHFAGELLKSTAQLDVVHVPYKGIPEALTDTIAGRVQFFMTPPVTLGTMLKDGKVRALGVTGRKRVRSYPDVPTVSEAGISGFVWESWAGILAPARTPREIVNKLNQEIAAILKMPDIQQRFVGLGTEPTPSTPAEFDKLVASELKRVAELARKAGIKPQ